MNEDYVRNLENVIKQMLRPLRNIPLNLVIETLSGHKVIPFNPDDSKDKKVLQKLIEASRTAGQKVNEHGILRPRPNEVGNDIESFVRQSLNSIGYKAVSPATKSGRTKTTGYPDIEFVDEFGRSNYLECKTYNINNIATTQRSFYLSPSENFKVTSDAHHFVISFEIYVDGRKGDSNIYKCLAWKVLSIEKLLVDVKYEFNSSLSHTRLVSFHSPLRSEKVAPNPSRSPLLLVNLLGKWVGCPTKMPTHRLCYSVFNSDNMRLYSKENLLAEGKL